MAWRYDNDVGGKQSPASGGLWYVKRGNIVVLAELMWWAGRDLTCYDIYTLWASLPIFAHKKRHSESQAPHAVKTRNAKILRHAETGRWGLNERGSRQRRA